MFMAAMMLRQITTLCLLLHTVYSQFDPLLNVESCTKDKLRVTTYGATSYGLIYIQGKGENCQRPTQEGLAVYEFDFTQCDIQWEMLFKIIIQKNAGFQTGADKQIPIFCIPDETDIVVNSDKIADASDDAGLNKTVRPTASMTFYKVVSNEEVSGNEVKLTDVLIMALQLGEQWTADFDIKARYCIASDIVLIENFCAVDPDLFPNFSKLQTGYLISQFGAFRPTTLGSGAIDMNFTCILEVCKEVCEATTCGNELGWGRKKREVIPDDAGDSIISSELGLGEKKRETTQDDANDSVTSPEHKMMKRQAAENTDIDVGARVKIVEKYSEITILSDDTFCLSSALFVVVIILLSVGCITFAAMTVLMYRKWTSAHLTIKKLTNQRQQRNSTVSEKGLINQIPVQQFENFYGKRFSLNF